MKKYFVVVITLAVTISLIFLTYNSYKTATIDGCLDKVLNTVYNNSYEESPNWKLSQERNEKLEKYFTPQGFFWVVKRLYTTDRIDVNKELVANSTVENIEYEFTDTDNEDKKICNFTISISLDYITGNKANGLMVIEGIANLEKDEKRWRIGAIQSFRHEIIE